MLHPFRSLKIEQTGGYTNWKAVSVLQYHACKDSDSKNVYHSVEDSDIS
jgi:hypothetical protein